MKLFVRGTLAAGCLLFAAGCLTDELVVYKETELSKEAMEPFAGVYQVDQWPGDTKPESVRMAEEDGKFHFSYSLADTDVQVRFVLSKVPNSEKDLYLLSIPAQERTNQSNMFFLGRAKDELTQIWAVFSNLPVAQGHLKFQDGVAKAEDVRAFLAEHADAFVTANEPQVTLKKG